MDDALKQKLRERLVARRRDQFAFLADLVRVPSENPPGDCAAHAEHTAGLLSQLGFNVQRYEVPDDVSASFGRAGVVNLVAGRRPGGNPALVLSTNGDTPPAGNRWRGDPFEPAISN
jgi:succinyl-diaminopimelate desuccinylase